MPRETNFKFRIINFLIIDWCMLNEMFQTKWNNNKSRVLLYLVSH